MSFLKGMGSGLGRLLRGKLTAWVAVVIFGLGIGPTAVFLSWTHGFMMRPLPFEGADHWLDVRGLQVGEEGRESFDLSSRDVGWMQQESPGFLAAYSMWMSFAAAQNGTSEAFVIAAVTPEIFTMTGERPKIGRWIEARDQESGAENVVIIGHEVWLRLFDGDEDVLGRELRLQDRSATVIGVAPEAFAFPHSQELWVPLAVDRPRSESPPVSVVAFSSASRDRGLVAEKLTGLLRRSLTEDGVPEAETRSVVLRPYVDAHVEPRLKAMIGPMAVAVALMWLMSCLHVAGLLGTHVLSRSRDDALRLALGARRSDLVGFVLGETAVLGLLGSALGLWSAWGGVRVLERWWERADFLRAFWMKPSLDWAVFVALASIAFLAVALASLLPIRKILKIAPFQALRRAFDPRAHRRRSADVLLLVEVAAATVLTICATLLMQSVWNLKSEPTGFESAHRWTAKLSLLDSGAGAVQTVDAASIFDRLRQGLLARPDVEAVSFSRWVPTEGTSWSSVEVKTNDGGATGAGTTKVEARGVAVDEFYFQTLGLDLLQGRSFSQVADPSASGAVAVVSRSFAERYLGTNGTSSFRLRIEPQAGSAERQWRRIVGVVEDAVMGPAADDRGAATIYVPITEQSFMSAALIVAGRVDSVAKEQLLREVLASTGHPFGFFHLRSLDTLLQRRRALYDAFATVFVVFGAAALCLTLAGLFTLTATLARARYREFGLRLALGASPDRVLKDQLTHSLKCWLPGILVGSVLSLFAVGPIEPFLFGVSPFDGVTYWGSVAFLTLAGLMVSLSPAVEAAWVDPHEALRDS